MNRPRPHRLSCLFGVRKCQIDGRRVVVLRVRMPERMRCGPLVILFFGLFFWAVVLWVLL